MTRSDEHYDELETRDPEAREREQLLQLSQQIAHAKENSSYYSELLADVDAAAINSREALSQLPTTRKSDLALHQKKQRPLGGMNAVPLSELRHIFASPGGIYEPDGHAKDYWRYGRALWAAGVRAGDIVHNTFSYHLTPAAMLVESGAHAIGCPVFPGGVHHLHWPFEDPAAVTGTEEQRKAAFRTVRDQIRTRLQGFIKQQRSRHNPPAT